MSNRSRKWNNKHFRYRRPSPVRLIDPQSGEVIAILPVSGKPKRRKPVRIVWRSYDDVVMRTLDEMRK
jgi:hypothetical protein